MDFRTLKSGLLPWVSSLTAVQQELLWNTYRESFSQVESEFEYEDFEDSEDPQDINQPENQMHEAKSQNEDIDEEADFLEKFSQIISLPRTLENPYTQERINQIAFSDIETFIGEELREARDKEEFDVIWNNFMDFIENSIQFDAESFEDYFVKLIEEHELHTEIFCSFHTFYGRDAEIELDTFRYWRDWYKAIELADQGDRSKLDEMCRPTPLAKVAMEQRLRITRVPDDCFVCSRLVKAYDGELLIWSEIPRSVHMEFMPYARKKWHVRHLLPPCNDEKYGKREHLEHLVVEKEVPNSKGEACWLCGKDVPAGEGWLIFANQIPKWKRSPRAFPGAKEKKYYVQCCKGPTEK